MILCSKLTDITELELALDDPDHVARCKYNPTQIHYQCRFCGKICHETRQIIRHKLTYNPTFKKLNGLFCCMGHLYKFIKLQNAEKQ